MSASLNNIDDAEIRELLADSTITDTSTGEHSGEHSDDAYIRELLKSTQSDGHGSNHPVDIEQLKAMLAGLLQNSANGNKKQPTNTREALRMKLKQKQHSRMSKYAINVQTEKKTKPTPHDDSSEQ